MGITSVQVQVLRREIRRHLLGTRKTWKTVFICTDIIEFSCFLRFFAQQRNRPDGKQSDLNSGGTLRMPARLRGMPFCSVDFLSVWWYTVRRKPRFASHWRLRIDALAKMPLQASIFALWYNHSVGLVFAVEVKKWTAPNWKNIFMKNKMRKQLFRG